MLTVTGSSLCVSIASRTRHSLILRNPQCKALSRLRSDSFSKQRRVQNCPWMEIPKPERAFLSEELLRAPEVRTCGGEKLKLVLPLWPAGHRGHSAGPASAIGGHLGCLHSAALFLEPSSDAQAGGAGGRLMGLLLALTVGHWLPREAPGEPKNPSPAGDRVGLFARNRCVCAEVHPNRGISLPFICGQGREAPGSFSKSQASLAPAMWWLPVRLGGGGLREECMPRGISYQTIN